MIGSAPNGRLYGTYRARVIDTVHPKGLMLAKVRVDALWHGVPDDVCPWAEYNLEIGGSFAPTIKGDLVWVDFPYDGDSRRPRITGMCQDAPGGDPNVPRESWSGSGEYIPPEVEDAPTLRELNDTKDYVYNRNGLLEIKTSGGSWSVTHLASDTTMGMNESGQVYVISTQNVFVQGDTGVMVKSGADIEMIAVGDIKMTAGGSLLSEAAFNTKFQSGQSFESTSAINTKFQTGMNTEITTGMNTKVQTGLNTQIQTGINTSIVAGVNVEVRSGAMMTFISKMIAFIRG
ncbi:hypothetical protein L6019_RS23500 [Escherichia coli]|nr:hypothetical protein [Escherichia coli]ELM8776556.1 hypothetical protein [Escherichia coli]EMA4402871.1 hypothetical protein [Escherichia coli]HEL5853103.1 hypothetical protein [Escherichia coli]